MRFPTRDIPIRWAMLIVFGVLLATSLLIAGGVFFTGWSESADDAGIRLAEAMSGNIQTQVDRFLEEPYHVNRTNLDLLEKGIVDLEVPAERERFFSSVLETHGESIYSFSFGGENGEYHGARRTPEGRIEIMRQAAANRVALPPEKGDPPFEGIAIQAVTGDLVVQALPGDLHWGS